MDRNDDAVRQAARTERRAARRHSRWLALALETHISLPLFAAALVAAMWVATIHFIEAERAGTVTAARAASRELADTYEAQVARSLAGIDQTLKVVKYAVELNGARQALPALRQQGLLPPSVVFVVAVVDADGDVVASSPAAPPYNVAGEEYFAVHRRADTGAPYVSATGSDPGKREPHLHFTRRINGPGGRFAGVAVVEVEPAYFTSSYERLREGEHGLLALVGTDGKVRAMRVGERQQWGQHLDLDRIAAGSTGPLRLGDGVPRYLSVRSLHGFPLAAVVGLSEQEQIARFIHQRGTYLAAAGIGTAVIVLAVALVSAWSWQSARARRRVRRARETFAAASEASLDALFVLSAVRGDDGRITDFLVEEANSRAEQMTGLAKQQLKANSMCGLVPHYRDNGILEALVRVVEQHEVHEAEWQAQTLGARGRWLHRQVVPFEGGVVAYVRDITERKLAEERIVHMAHHDDLTGLPNRTLLRERLTEAIARAARRGQHLALAFVDLDGFKLINDGLGHNAGDELLKAIGARMHGCLRRNDTLARFGGDEFVLLLPGVADDPQALAPLLEKVRLAVTEPVQVSGQVVQVSCSMGVVMYPRDGHDANTLMMNADAAMYRAKDAGRNTFRFYDPAMNASGEQNLALLEGMRQSLESTLHGGAREAPFTLAYQPKVDLRSGRLFGVEALLRWRHPEFGAVAPQRFIPLAEESGLIVPIGDWVLRTACRQVRAWRDAGLPPVTVSVNVSPRQFEEARLVERVAAALAESGLPAGALELEVTESLIMRDLAQSVEKMRQLEGMGLSLSIDDFGTGYSSLSALKSFPISRLKIDKSFVSELAENPDDQAIALAVISLGHRLNLRVIAEGVETAQQCAFLRDHECDEMQGYLYSRPLPPEQIAAMMASGTQWTPAGNEPPRGGLPDTSFPRRREPHFTGVTRSACWRPGRWNGVPACAGTTGVWTG